MSLCISQLINLISLSTVTKETGSHVFIQKLFYALNLMNINGFVNKELEL